MVIPQKIKLFEIPQKYKFKNSLHKPVSDLVKLENHIGCGIGKNGGERNEKDISGLFRTFTFNNVCICR